MSLRVLLVRHAQTAWNRERRYQGLQDQPLAPEGLAQAEALARALRDEPLAAVYTSPLLRARATAAAIAAPHGLPLRELPLLREMSFGAWEGRLPDEVRSEDPERFRGWMERPHEVGPPGGEPLGEVRSRALAALAHLREAHRGETVCVVTHGVVVRMLVLEALGLPVDRIWSVHSAPAGISELEFRDDWTALHRMNTLAHLEALLAAG